MIHLMILFYLRSVAWLWIWVLHEQLRHKTVIGDIFYLRLCHKFDDTFWSQIGCPIKNLGFTRAIGNQRLANAHRDSGQRRFFKEIAQKITFVWPQLGQWQISLDLTIHDHLGVCKVSAIYLFAYHNLSESTSGS